MPKPMLRFLVLLDCICNWMLLGNFNETMSSRADRMRTAHQKYWWWVAYEIDAIASGLFFQRDHCRTSYTNERAKGGALVNWVSPRVIAFFGGKAVS